MARPGIPDGPGMRPPGGAEHLGRASAVSRSRGPRCVPVAVAQVPRVGVVVQLPTSRRRVVALG